MTTTNNLIAVTGDIHGHLSVLYEKVFALQKELGRPIDSIFQVGDFHLYTDESRVDGAVLRHGGPGEFPLWFREGRSAPIPTYVILGNHDDATLFYEYAGREIVPSLHLLPQGEVLDLTVNKRTIRIGVIGGNYSSKNYPKEPDQLQQARKRHYTRTHINSVLNQAPVDILLTHEAPLGFIVRRGSDVGRPEINELIERLQPKLAFFGHHHTRVSGQIGTTIVTGLDHICHEGSIALVEFHQSGPFILSVPCQVK